MSAKDRLTATSRLLNNATGSKKVPLTLIGKANNPRCFRRRKPAVTYFSQTNAWSDTRIFKLWCTNVFLLFVQAFTSRDVIIMDKQSRWLRRPEGSIDNIEVPTQLHQQPINGLGSDRDLEEHLQDEAIFGQGGSDGFGHTSTRGSEEAEDAEGQWGWRKHSTRTSSTPQNLATILGRLHSRLPSPGTCCNIEIRPSLLYNWLPCSTMVLCSWKMVSPMVLKFAVSCVVQRR